MKAINDLYEAMLKHNEERRVRRAVRHMAPWIRRDIGLEIDPDGRVSRHV